MNISRTPAILHPLLIAIIMGMAALTAVSSLHAVPGKDARAAYEKAERFRSQYHYRAARIELLNAIKADPKWPDAHIAKARIELDLFNGLAARSELDKAIILGAPTSNVQHLLGHAMWLEGDLDGAVNLLSDPDIPAEYFAYAQRILGRVQMDRNDYAAAESAFSRALEIDPESSMLWTEIARFRYVSGNQQAAIEAVDHAVSLDNDNVRALEFRGRLVRTQFGLLAALPWFERALLVNPKDVLLLEEYAATLGEAGRYRDMLKQSRKILTLDKGNGRAFYMQAVIAARAGDYGLARRILAKAGPDMNSKPGAMLISGISEYELGNINQAIEIFRRLVLTQQANMDYRKLLARAMYRNGDALDTLDEIRAVAGRPDADNYSLMIAARAFEASGDHERAAMALNDAGQAVIRHNIPLAEMLSLPEAARGAQANPDDARYVVPYIRSLMLEKLYDEAADQAKRLQAGNPGVANAHLIAGDVEMERGEVSAAINAYNRARQITFSEGVMLRLVDAYRRAGQDEEAHDALTSFLAYNPSNLSAQRLMAYSMLDNREWAAAIPLLESVKSRIGYNDSILLANLARAYSGIGRNDEAISYASIAYRIDPANPMVTYVYGKVLLTARKRLKSAKELLEKALILMPENKDVISDLNSLRTNKYRG